MNQSQPSIKSRSCVTGLFAALDAFLRDHGGGVSFIRAFLPTPTLILTLLVTTLGVLGGTGGTALAAKQYVLGGSFGSEGSGSGQLEEPTGVAVNDATGNVYVLDRGNDRVQEFNSTGTTVLAEFNGAAAPTGVLSSPESIAVDNSGSVLDPANGDVYVADTGHHVIDQFTASGTYVGQLRETSAGSPFGFVYDVAVDSAGDLWVSDSPEEVSGSSIDEFSDTGSFVKTFNTGWFAGPEFSGLAINTRGDLYLNTYFGRVAEFDSASGEEIVEERFAGVTRALALNPANNDLLLDKETSIELYEPFSEPTSHPRETFPSEGLSNSQGIGVSNAGIVYATQRGADDVEVFNFVSFPTVANEGISEVSSSSVTLNGSVNPEGEPLTECKFEYGTTESYGQEVPCEHVPTGSEPKSVRAKVSGLEPRTAYHFRLLAANKNGVTTGNGEAFFTVDTPLVESESVVSTGSTEASVTAQIDASGSPTTYHVEYGAGEAYGLSTPEVNLGAAQGAVGVLVRLSGLQAGTKYHFRFVAVNSLGTHGGSDETLATTASLGPAALTLPDGRAYELVSSPNSNANVQPPSGELGASNATATLVRAAASGNAVVYQGDPAPQGGAGDTGQGNGNAYIATRGPAGWAQANLQLFPGLRYEGFSSDLSVGVLDPEWGEGLRQVALPSATPAAPANCTDAGSDRTTADPLFAHTSSDGAYHALLSATPTPDPTRCGANFAGANAGTGAVPQYDHILFQGYAVLTSDAVAHGEGEDYNLYDSVDGTPHLVSVLPDGTPDANAVFTGDNAEAKSPVSSSEDGSPDDISADGSRVFWAEEDFVYEHQKNSSYHPLALYVRENDAQPQSPVVDGRCVVASDACTVQLDVAQAGAKGKSGGGLFWAASSDGSRVFFSDENQLTVGSTAAPGEPDLYEYDVSPETGAAGVLTDLTLDEHPGEHANVQGVMGASEDGSYVYFVADGVLTAGANAEGHEPVAGQPNLYVRHNGMTSFIAMAGNEEESMTSAREIGNLMINAGDRTAQATAGGPSLVFRSRNQLTGYESLGLPEVFVYDADSQRLSCVSCDPSGTSPTHNLAGDTSGESRDGSLYERGASLTTSANSDFMLRWISENGNRVFFVTGQPLVPGDVNGLQDVYEWERPGSGSEVDNSCTVSSSSYSVVNGGCVYLLSGGTGTDDSYFLDASATGDDVFIRTRAKLAPQAVNENMALYDVRVGGGFAETSLACTGTGCQGVPPAPPMFATPSSVTFDGVGNFPPPSAKAVVKPKSLTKAQKLAKALKGCKKDKVRKRRTSCEKKVRGGYGATKASRVSHDRRIRR
jgi:hypothetical protein